jgi:hypothetical protein
LPCTAASFIPFAEPTAQYVGIENNYLKIAQNNGLADAVRRLMQTPGHAKFVLSVGESDADRLSSLLSQFDLKLDDSPCAPIWSNLQVHPLGLCRIAGDEASH